MSNFEQYLQKYEIDAVRLAITANVRYLTAWNAQKGHPIPPQDARKIKTAVLTLTGVAFTGSFGIAGIDRGRSVSCKNR